MRQPPGEMSQCLASSRAPACLRTRSPLKVSREHGTHALAVLATNIGGTRQEDRCAVRHLEQVGQGPLAHHHVRGSLHASLRRTLAIFRTLPANPCIAGKRHPREKVHFPHIAAPIWRNESEERPATQMRQFPWRCDLIHPLHPSIEIGCQK